MTRPQATPTLPSFGGDDARPCGYAEARVAILPVPYEGTVSYGGGASQGPRAILEASAQLEMYDEELDTCIDRVGLHTLPPVTPEPGAPPEALMEAIHRAALPPLKDGKLLVTLGGEHSISYGVFTALLEARRADPRTRDRPLSLLQIDAHADLRPSYQGTPHSHACIMARAHELGLPFVQVGIRAISQPERDFLRETGLDANVFWGKDLYGHADNWIAQAIGKLHEDVYVTLDVDGLDPSIMPATGTPEPGGLDWPTTLSLLRAVAEARNVVGFDLTELAPIPALNGPDYLCARLTYKMIGYALRLHGA